MTISSENLKEKNIKRVRRGGRVAEGARLESV